MTNKGSIQRFKHTKAYGRQVKKSIVTNSKPDRQPRKARKLLSMRPARKRDY